MAIIGPDTCESPFLPEVIEKLPIKSLRDMIHDLEDELDELQDSSEEESR
jgi:hypothetical protein